MKFAICFAVLITVVGRQVSCSYRDNQILFDDLDFDTWVHTVPNWQDFTLEFLNHVPANMKKTFCSNATEGVRAIIGELKLKFQLKQLDFLPITKKAQSPSPSLSNIRENVGRKGSEYKRIPDRRNFDRYG